MLDFLLVCYIIWPSRFISNKYANVIDRDIFEICMGFVDIDPTSKVKGWLIILYFSQIEAISYVSVKEAKEAMGIIMCCRS